MTNELADYKKFLFPQLPLETPQNKQSPDKEKLFDWSKDVDLTGRLNNIGDIKSLYESLFKAEYSEDDESFMFHRERTRHFLGFIENFGSQCASTKGGEEFLREVIQENKFPSFFSTVHDGFAESYEEVRAEFIKACFKGDQKEAARFCIDLLPKLDEKTRRILKKQWEAYREEGEQNENDPINFSRESYQRPFDANSSTSPHESKIWHEAAASHELFPFSTKAILSGIAESGARGNADASYVKPLIEYLKKDLNAPSHIEELSKALQNVGSAAAANELLAIARDKNENEFTKKLATNILYRLEFGRVQVSQKGVEYLNRLYSLYEPATGELFNNTAYSARRVTRHGEIGLFDERDMLVKYFKLGNLATDEHEVARAVLPLAYWMFRVSRIDLPEKAELDDDFEKLQRNYLSYLEHRFFKDTGVSFSNFSFLEQGEFIRFIENSSDEKRQKAFEFVKKYGENGFRAFLSLDYGEEYGNALFEIGESMRIRPDEASLIFKSYNDLNDQALSLSERIDDSPFFHEAGLDKEVSSRFVEQLAEGILRRAKDMLNTARSVAKNGIAEAPFYDKQSLRCDKPEDIIIALSTYKSTLEKLECLLDYKNDSTRYECSLKGKDTDSVPLIYEFELKDKTSGVSSYLSVQLREYGAPLHEHNSEREFDGEARINILVSDEPIGRLLADRSRQKAISFRIDREGKRREDGRIVENNPAQADGELSLEIGFVGEGDVVGRVVAIGNALGEARREGREEKYPQYYHNRESFMKELGDAETFAKIVRFIRSQIEAYYMSETHPKVSLEEGKAADLAYLKDLSKAA